MKKTDTISYNDLSNKPTIPVVDSALSATSTNAIQNKAVTARLTALENAKSSPSAATVANVVFGSGGNARYYRVFCRMKKTNQSGDGEIVFIGTNMFDFGAFCEGIYLIQCSNRGRMPHMQVVELLAPIGGGGGAGQTLEFGYYTTDDYFYFGYWTSVYPGSTSLTILGRDNQNNAEAGTYYNSVTKPDGWTPITFRKMAYQDQLT
ncbi:MAG: hypothetical protein NC218_09610 [Acetobacter sp.]|nr:hypothetical protein [Acetobacter sp.]